MKNRSLNRSPHVAIVGGGIGMLIAAELAANNVEVSLVCRQRHIDPIREMGLRVTEPGKSERNISEVFCVTHIDELGARPLPSLVIVAVKSFDTLNVLRSIKEIWGEDVPVLCAQNGIRNEEIAAGHFRTVWGASVNFGADQAGPGIVRARGSSRQLSIGPYRGSSDPMITDLLSLGLEIREASDIMAVKRGKMIWNAASSVGAVVDASWMEIAASPDLMEIVSAIRVEAESGFRKLGLSCIDPMSDSEGTPQIFKQDTRGSTWYALKNRTGKVETAFFNGELVGIGAVAGIQTPANAVLLRMTQEMARQGIAPGTVTPAFLRQQIREYRDRENAANAILTSGD